MYREPHLNEKNKECADIWYEWYNVKYLLKDKEKAKKLRENWCQCCDEFSEMISEELKTNPRYIGKNIDIKHLEPPR